jgi:hypothetical protein
VQLLLNIDELLFGRLISVAAENTELLELWKPSGGQRHAVTSDSPAMLQDAHLRYSSADLRRRFYLYA